MTIMEQFNWLDVTTFVVNQLGYAVGSIFFVSLVFLIPTIFLSIAYLEDQIKSSKVISVMVVLWACSLVLTIIVCLTPTHEKVLEVKISKIKNEAVSKENIDKGLDKIEEVLGKLECKYLGCEDKN